MEKFYCVISGQELPSERVEALQFLGIPKHLWTTVENSQVQKIKGIWAGESGCSELILADALDVKDGVERVDPELELLK